MLFTKFARFAVVGAVATGIQYVVLIVLVHLAVTTPVLASSVGFAVSALFNYLLNYHFTFGSSQRHGPAIAKFLVLAVAGLGLNAAIMQALTSNGLYYVVAQVFATVGILVWNFVGNSYWTFREDSTK